MQIDLIIFDLDGTLIDSKEDIANSVNYMLSELGLNRLENETIYSYVGKGVPRLVERALSKENLDKFDKALSLFKEHYSEHLLDITTLYPNVIDTLNHYKSKKKALVTNKDERYTFPILNELDISDYFEIILCGDSMNNKKPHPEPINSVIDKLKIDKKQSVIVGDGNADITAGKNAEIFTCGVTYGFGSREELESANADIIIEDIIDLKDHFF